MKGANECPFGFNYITPTFFRICNPKVILIRILNPDSMSFGVANPEERGIANPLLWRKK